MFSKILVANRGEIACRVMRTARKLGVKTVAVYSEADRNSMHVSMADEAYLVGPPPSKDSYLRGDRILQIAKSSGAQAIHPGYGFLSENAGFADECEKSRVVFIGPPSSAIRAMGSKSASKDIMMEASVPLIPGYHGEDQSLEKLLAEAEKIKYPVLIKAVMGGGGKGMRIVERREDFEEALNSAKRESLSSFGDDRVLIEKYITHPRHVEMQVFADTLGNAVYLFERDCSVQRRHQKVLEEAPAPGMTAELRSQMGKAAVAAAKQVGYVGAGTVEFIMDSSKNFYFMEMNTRLQVEHPITEMITKQDLVEWQLKVAAGHRLPLLQNDLKIHGHAFESRVYAENPRNNFLPGTGKLIHLSTPTPSDHVRIDTGVRQGDEVSVYYDPMIAKLVVWGEDRTSALQKTRLALEQYKIVGLQTNIDFLGKLAAHPAFIAGDVETGFIEKHKADLLPPLTAVPSTGLALSTLALLLLEVNQQAASARSSFDPWSPFRATNGKRLNTSLTRDIKLMDEDKEVHVNVHYMEDGSFKLKLPHEHSTVQVRGTLQNGELRAFIGDQLINGTVVVEGVNLHVFYQGKSHTLRIPVKDYGGSTAAKGSLLAPMPGKIVKVLVQPNQHVKKGAPLMIMEAMKMEHTIRAPVDGVVEKINYNLNDLVEEKKQLLSIMEDSK